MANVTLKQTEYPVAKKVSRTGYPKTVKISYRSNKAKVSELLPFRVKFLPATFSEFGPGNPAPIGIAIVGINNYIL